MSVRIAASSEAGNVSVSTISTTSSGATEVFEFNANDAADIVTGSDGVVVRVLNSLDPSQFLTVRTGADDNPVTVAADSGARGTSRTLQFDATRISPNLADASTNWLSAGGIDGTAGSALVRLADSSNLSTSGSFTTVIALKIDRSYNYGAGPIWGTLASPGPLQYVQLRINTGSNVQGADLTDEDEVATNAQGAVTTGWHVMTMIKHANLLTYRLDGAVVQTSVITSTASFTAGDFMIGGGYPQGPTADLSQENGVPPPDVGEFQAYSGALSGTGLTQAEALAASSIDISLPGNPNVYLGGTATVYAAAAGDIVHAGTGAATVTAAAGSVTLYGSSGPLLFVGGTGSSSVAGGSGVLTVQGGSGGGHFSSGTSGGSVLVAGGGNTTLTGGGNGDRLFGSAGGQDVMIASNGRESLIGGDGSTTITGGATAAAVIFTDGNTTVTGGAAGGDTVVGGAGSLTMRIHNDAVFAGSGAASVTGGTSGQDSIIGGSGRLSVAGHGDNMVVVGGSGVSTIDTGNGANLVYAGSGTMTLGEGSGAATLLIGSGSTRTDEGTGAVTYDVVYGAAGGIDVIDGYRPGTDTIALFGYGSEQTGILSSGGNTQLSLSDGTRITLLGISDPGTILTA